MPYCVKFGKQGPVDARADIEERKIASKELIEAVLNAAKEDNPVEALIRAGFSAKVSWR